MRDAIEILREYGVSQMPVVKAEPPVMSGEVAGSVSERALLEALFTGAGAPEPTPVERTWSPVAARRRRRAGQRRPHGARARRRGARRRGRQAVGVLTRADLLGFLVG
jgi:cystathionine beta-synthase